jgi:hypothetical protein
MGIVASRGLVRSCSRVSSHPVAGWIELKYTEITDAQREILKHVYDTDDASTISQMWYVHAKRPDLGC